MMNIKTVKTLWGVTPAQGNEPGSYLNLFNKIKADGFSAVETPIWMVADPVDFCAALASAGLSYVAMINTCLPADDPHLGSRELAAHVASFERQLNLVIATIPPALLLLVNSHSGCDSWPLATSTAFFTAALVIEDRTNVLVCHETHRGRALFNPWVTRDVCRTLPRLRLTADLSHFCVVGERVYADDDADWKECFAEVARATRHIHARVGYAQGPQVNDPRAPEHAAALATHEKWWDAIVAAQAASGVKMLTLEPEHGVDGYQQLLPYSQLPVSDVWEVNKWLRDRQTERLTKLGYTVA